MKIALKYLLPVLLALPFLGAKAQVLTEDTATNQAFFKAKSFKSACYVGFEGTVTQVLKKNAGLDFGLSLNWVINHKYVVTARYYTLTTPVNVQKIVAPDRTDLNTVNMAHQFAGLGFSYVLFDNKMFSFQPELTAGWASVKYKVDHANYRKDFAEVIPAVYGVYNATKNFRLGAGLNYRIAAGSKLNGLKDGDIGGIGGVVFIRVGTF